MNMYKLTYCEGVSEIIYAENEDHACDNSSYPEAHIRKIELIKSEKND